MCGFLAGSGAAPQALLVVLEFVACFSGTQETAWRLCRPCSPVRPPHGSLACWLGHLATLGFVFIQTSSDTLRWLVCACVHVEGFMLLLFIYRYQISFMYFFLLELPKI